MSSYRDFQEHVHWPVGLGYVPGLDTSSFPRTFETHVYLPPGLCHDPRVHGRFHQGTDHGLFHMPAGMSYHSAYDGPFHPHAHQASRTQHPYERFDRHHERQQRSAAEREHVTSETDADSGLSSSSRSGITTVPENDTVHYTTGWWNSWPGITTLEAVEVSDYVNGLHNKQFAINALIALQRGRRFPDDDAMTDVRDLYEAWQRHEQRKEMASSAAEPSQKKTETTESSPSAPHAESPVATTAASHSVSSERLFTPSESEAPTSTADDAAGPPM